jgi:ribosomal protein S11
MLLVQIKSFIQEENELQKVLHDKRVSQKLKQQKAFLESFKTAKTLIKTDFFYNLNKSDVIRYIIGVRFLKRNTVVYITDVQGRLKHCASEGHMKLNKKQKTKFSLVLIKLTRSILAKLPDLKRAPIAIHLINVVRSVQFSFESAFKTQFFVVQLVSFKAFPHNGCRPKKLKRKKRKKLIFQITEEILERLKRSDCKSGENLFLFVGSNPTFFKLLRNITQLGSVSSLGLESHVFKSHYFEVMKSHFCS